ncbi:GNAT family N-acetyltransferase [Streptomyces aureoverticillatus]|uniref:GNAT family N-acetyltransferase n=1 Tax=Streptomyces aureoverticillatus TaxID=66871 RepID=UPI0028125767|nr:GNAT family N-acetyltransferase [Streptomyces aureoverticillatus]
MTAQQPAPPPTSPARTAIDWPVSLATPRLTLRPVAEPDVPDVVRLWTDPEVRRHLGGPVAEDVVRARRSHCVGARGVFSVVRTADGAVLGLAVAAPDARDGRTEVSYQFLPEHWGKGYAREAVAAVVDWAGSGVRSSASGVVAVTQAANRRSRRLLEGLGATVADTFVEWGEPQVLYVFGAGVDASVTATLCVPGADGLPGMVLRPWRDDDAAALIDVYRDPLMRRWTRMPVSDRADAARWLEVRHRGWERGDYLSFAVVEQGEGALSGLVANVVVKGPRAATGVGEVGYWTAARARGRGVASRALDALTDWAFGTFGGGGLHWLHLLHQVDNAASCRVAEKTGYELNAVLPVRPPFPAPGHLHVRRRVTLGRAEKSATSNVISRPLPAR